MIALLTFVLIVAAILLMLIVLVQTPKSSGMSQGMASTQKLFGVKNTLNFLEKGTWILAGTVLGVSLLFNLFPADSSQNVGNSLLKEQVDKANSNPIPTAPQQETQKKKEGIIDPSATPPPVEKK